MSVAFERRRRQTTTITEKVWQASEDRTTTTEKVTVTTTYRVTGATAVPQWGGHKVTATTRFYVPTRVEVEHRPGSKGGPEVSVWGHRTLKDGKLSDTTTRIYFFGSSTYARSPWPEWLIELVQDAAR